LGLPELFPPNPPLRRAMAEAAQIETTFSDADDDPPKEGKKLAVGPTAFFKGPGADEDEEDEDEEEERAPQASGLEPPRMSARQWAGEQKPPLRASAHGSEGGTAPRRQSDRRSQLNVAGPPLRTSAYALAEGLEPRNSVTALTAGVVPRDLLQRLLAECVGTFMLVLTVGLAVTGAGPQAAFAIGGVLSVQIYTFGSVSGGLFNPAVTLAVLLSGRKKIAPTDALCYVAAQFVGGFLGGAFAFAFAGSTFFFDVEMSQHGSGYTCCLLEMFFTAALCIAVLTTGTSTDTPNDYFGFAIGGTVLASAIACGMYDQGSLNPAVTFGINIGHYMHSDDPDASGPSAASWFLYLFAPCLGSVLGAGLFVATRLPEVLGRPQEGHSLKEKAVAEFVGTFYLVFTVGVAATPYGGGAFGPVAIGVMLAVQVYSFGSVSGACLNPAVALAVLLSRRGKLEPKSAGFYVLAEFMGAFFAGVAAMLVTGGETVHLEEQSFGTALGLEIFFTFALCMTVLTTGTSRDAPNQYFGFAIGLTVTACAYAASSYGAGSFNPAVTVGIMLADTMGGNATLGSSWAIFLLGPVLGGALAAGAFYLTRRLEYFPQGAESDPVQELADALNGLEKHGSVRTINGKNTE